MLPFILPRTRRLPIIILRKGEIKLPSAEDSIFGMPSFAQGRFKRNAARAVNGMNIWINDKRMVDGMRSPPASRSELPLGLHGTEQKGSSEM